jgi:hypothetical protein
LTKPAWQPIQFGLFALFALARGGFINSSLLAMLFYCLAEPAFAVVL